jgi:hypothetical protein
MALRLGNVAPDFAAKRADRKGWTALKPYLRLTPSADR